VMGTIRSPEPPFAYSSHLASPDPLQRRDMEAVLVVLAGVVVAAVVYLATSGHVIFLPILLVLPLGLLSRRRR